MPHGRQPPQHAAAGYVHGGTVRAEFAASLLALARKQGGTRVDVFLAAPSGPNISEARNLLVRRFLEETRAAWLWMLDTDMVFAPDALDRLVAAASEDAAPIVGALCYSQDEAGGDPHPTMYELVEQDGQPGFARYRTWAEGALVPVAATGAACLLMHRTALERIEAAAGQRDRAAPWFRESVMGAALVGEDMTFCLRAGAAGIPVHVHTGVEVGHMKPVMLGKVT
jgi:GT2 family glycosyltransferase